MIPTVVPRNRTYYKKYVVRITLKVQQALRRMEKLR